MTSKETGTTWK